MEQFDKSAQINLGSDDLKKYFISHLNKIYRAKYHLLSQLPDLATIASLDHLKQTIATTTHYIKRQIERIDQIYKELNERPQPEDYSGFKALIDDVYKDIYLQQGNRQLQDMAIIYYLQNIDSLQMASFQTLQLAAVKFKNQTINTLLQDNFNDSNTERDLLLQLSARYLDI